MISDDVCEMGDGGDNLQLFRIVFFTDTMTEEKRHYVKTNKCVASAEGREEAFSSEDEDEEEEMVVGEREWGGAHS